MLRGFSIVSFICAGLLLSGITPIRAADWRQFRGTDSTGIAGKESLPTTWSATENIAWKAKLPGKGISGPIIVGQRVFVTASSGQNQDRLHVLAFDAESGKDVWERQFWATGRTMCHPKMAVATPQPASDGERIFAFYSSNDLICLDLDGNLLWLRGLGLDFPNASNSLGMSSSPVVIGDTVIVQVESDSESFAAGLDVTNGQQRWKIDRPKMSNWTSPGTFKGAKPEDDLVVMQSGKGLTAYKPRTGEQAWSYDNGASTIPSTGINGEFLMIPSNGLTALKVDGVSKNPKQLWNDSKLGPGTSSPVIYEGKVYILGKGGVLSCASVEDGKTLWQLRVKGDGGFSATPVVANGNLYLINENGGATVVKLGGEKGEIIGGGELAETVLGTPGISNGGLFVRSNSHLWKIAEAKK